jgi:hypothetical protein
MRRIIALALVALAITGAQAREGIPFHTRSPTSTEPIAPQRPFAPSRDRFARMLVQREFHVVSSLEAVDPAVRMELPLGKEPYLAQWYYDTLCSLRPQMEQLRLPIESLGNLDTLVQRLQAEVAESKTVACWFASVGAWCRKA